MVQLQVEALLWLPRLYPLIPPFAQASRFATSIAQKVEPGTAHMCVSQYLDLFNTRRVEHEGPLNSNTVRGDAAERECLIDTTAPYADDHTLHNLHTFAVTFYDANVNLDRVTGRKIRDFFFEILNGPD
jgi:hypothetical protein